MHLNYCTLFNSNYLDKGVVLYESLVNVADDFTLYILAMDDKCFDVLSDMALPCVKPIKLSDIEDDEMLKSKKNRSMGQYCWTCTSCFLFYLLNSLKLDNCTYLDSDMYFYQNPKVLIEEMLQAEASCLIVEHRFPKSEDRSNRVGRFCVEFNSFLNNSQGMEILTQWRKECIEECSQKDDGIHWGDQKYLDKWPSLYGKNVHVLKNLGGGVAPWNISQYRYIASMNGSIMLEEKSTNRIFNLVFYHFENIRFLNSKKATAPLYADSTKKDFVKALYANYLMRIVKHKAFLIDKYGISFEIKRHPTSSNREFGIGYYVRKIYEYIRYPQKGYYKYKSKRSFVELN